MQRASSSLWLFVTERRRLPPPWRRRFLFSWSDLAAGHRVGKALAAPVRAQARQVEAFAVKADRQNLAPRCIGNHDFRHACTGPDAARDVAFADPVVCDGLKARDGFQLAASETKDHQFPGKMRSIHIGNLDVPVAVDIRGAGRCQPTVCFGR